MFINTLSVTNGVALQRIHSLAAAMNAAAQKPSRHPQGFSDQLVRAVQARLSRSRHVVTAEHDSDFGEELKEAVSQQLGGLPAEKQQAERERERARYRPRRQRGKGE